MSPTKEVVNSYEALKQIEENAKERGWEPVGENPYHLVHGVHPMNEETVSILIFERDGQEEVAGVVTRPSTKKIWRERGSKNLAFSSKEGFLEGLEGSQE